MNEPRYLTSKPANPIVEHKRANDELNLYTTNGIESKLNHSYGTLTYPRESIDFVVEAMFFHLCERRRAFSMEELYKEATGFNFRDLIVDMQSRIAYRLSKKIRLAKQGA